MCLFALAQHSVDAFHQIACVLISSASKASPSSSPTSHYQQGRSICAKKDIAAINFFLISCFWLLPDRNAQRRVCIFFKIFFISPPHHRFSLRACGSFKPTHMSHLGEVSVLIFGQWCLVCVSPSTHTRTRSCTHARTRPHTHRALSDCRDKLHPPRLLTLLQTCCWCAPMTAIKVCYAM